MRNVEKLLLAGMMIVGCTAMAQDKIKRPVFEMQGELIKGTYYYEDGNIRQEGTYKNGELHGKWISYNKEGEKTASAEYADGRKTGTWLFWEGDEAKQVVYSDSKILSVNTRPEPNTLVTNRD